MSRTHCTKIMIWKEQKHNVRASLSQRWKWGPRCPRPPFKRKWEEELRRLCTLCLTEEENFIPHQSRGSTFKALQYFFFFSRESTAFELVLQQRSQRKKKTTTNGWIGRQLRCITLHWPTLWLRVNSGRVFIFFFFWTIEFDLQIQGQKRHAHSKHLNHSAEPWRAPLLVLWFLHWFFFFMPK